ncbi:MAG TPA: glycosyl hydrolase 53 family protein, partial [Acidimicrobiales bacterium]|nr:glycosyl hydrolase 53 family protein [Acidimicrobiales bacterium]
MRPSGALLAAALVTACSLGKGLSTASPSAPALPYAGADVSALARIEQAGGVFRSSGTAGDALHILRAQGMNTFRLRIFVNPNDSDVVVNDLPYTLGLATRVKATGAKLLLDFHYSDTWADPGHQATPAAWAALGFDSLKAQVERYTAGVIAALKHQGTLPDIVQVGNEIDAGFLWPLGQITGTGDTLTQWTQFTGLLKAGIQGVRDSLGPGDSVKIMLHYSQGGSTGGT